MKILNKLLDLAIGRTYGRFGNNKNFEILDKHILDCKNTVAFSLFGSSRRYLDGALLNIETYKRFFPEFKCRFYVSKDLPKSYYNEIIDNDAELIVMNGTGVNYLFTFWRFLNSEDTTKEIFLIRDVDSCSSDRERQLFLKWRASGAKFNIIRDHYSHNSRIMAGMWGGEVQDNLFSVELSKIWKFPNTYERDQLFLSSIIYPKIIKECLVQDIIHRFNSENIEISAVDELNYSFIGEIATNDIVRSEWRAEFKRIHNKFIQGNLIK